MSKEVKEIADRIFQLTYSQITELARGIGEIMVDSDGMKDVGEAVGGIENLRDAIFYWAESATQ